jgi:hypothetical protein
MKKILLITLFALTAGAQDVGVKVNNVDATQDTTISIKKGDQAAKKKYTLSEGEDDITGDKSTIMKDAEKSWKAACSEWKKEFKETNKDNKIIAINCGRMHCSKEGVESTCESKAKYKVRVLSEE